MRKELTQLRERGTFVPVHGAPKGVKVVHSSLMLTPKFGDNGELTTVKGRLVASGNEVDSSTYSIDETSSPTVSHLSMVTMLAAAAHERADVGAIDFPGAFLFATLGKNRYMWLGRDAATALVADCPSWKRYVKPNGTMMVRVEGALYGFAESGKRWYDVLSSFIVESGYTQSRIDPCVFFKTSSDGRLMLSLHVDDIFYVSTNPDLTRQFLSRVEQRFGKVKHKEGNIIPFLGMRIVKDSTGSISVDQPAYVNDLVDDIWDESVHQSPSHRDLLSRSDVGNELIDPSDFRSRVAKVMYLATKSRPDLLFTVSTLASRASKPFEADVRSLNHLYQYINTHRDHRMVFSPRGMELSVSVDASHDIHRDSKGHSGLVILIGGTPVFFRSTKQKTVATSAMQAEVAALFDAIPYITWFRDLLGELGYHQAGPTRIEQDNRSALTLYDGSGQPNARKSRHYLNKIAFIKELVDDGVILPEYIPTDQVLADKITKPFGGSKMSQFFGVEVSTRDQTSIEGVIG
jgi:hypothetical protein